MAVEIASLLVRFQGDVSGFNKSLSAVEKGMQETSRSLSSGLKGIGSSMTNMGTKMSVALAPVSLAMFKGINLASEYQDSIAEIGARAGLTSEELSRVSDYALQLGQDTAYSGMQASQALLELMTSGQSLEEAMVTLPQVMDLAAASGEDLGNVADGVTNVMAAFGLELEALPSVIDALNSAAGASSAGVGDLTAAFGNLGPVAANMGLDIGEASAAIAVLNENGIQGAEAGTALKSMLMNMANDTPAVTAAWDKLGTSMYDSAGNIRDFDTVLDEISTSLAAMPVEDQNRLLQDLAGSYGTVALQSLLGAGGIDTMLTAMDGVPGAAEVAEARLNTFSGRMDALKGSVETLMIKAMTPFMDNVLKPMAEKVTVVVNKITDWVAENPELSQTLVPIIAGVAALAASLVPLGMVLGFAGTAVGVLSGAFMLLISPIGLAIAAAGLLVAGYLTNFGGMRDFIDGEIRPALEKFFTFLGKVWEWVQPGIENLKMGVEIAFNFIKDTVIPALQKGWQDFTDWIGKFWEKIQPFINLAKEGIELAFNFIKDTVIPALTKAFNDFIDFVGKIWAVIGPPIQSIADGIGRIFKWIGEHVIAPFTKAVGTIIEAFADLYVKIAPHMDLVMAVAKETFTYITDKLISPFTKAIDGISTAIQWVADTIGGPLKTIGDLFQKGLGGIANLVDGIAGAVRELMSALGEVNGQVGAQIGGAGAAATGILGAAADYAAGLANPGSSGGSSGGGGASTTIGFASGTSWTGSMGLGDIAGFVHGQEAVIPAGGMSVIPSPRGLMIEGSVGMSGGGTGGANNVFTGDIYVSGVEDINDFYDKLQRVARQRA